MNRFSRAFEEPALVGYLVGGLPDEEAFVEYASALIDGGVDVLEVGIPFSDPIADGPTIQEATARALEASTRPRDVIASMGQIRERHPEVPLVAMTYANIAHRMGYGVFAKRLQDAGADGALLADMPPEAAGPVQEAFGEDLAQVFLASPATGEDRVRRIAQATRGFLYVVGRFGTTGAREALDPATVGVVERLAPIARKQGIPACVGFGVSSGEQARRLIEAGADGVVVGSAFVEHVLDGEDPSVIAGVAGSLKEGVRSASLGRGQE